MSTEAPDPGVKLGAWNAFVRRARMTTRQKLAALIVGSYADNDGTGIVAGVARLAVDMEASHRTARRYLAWLREIGLIELTAVGNRRKKKADEYRLIIGPHLGEHIDVPDPTKYKAMCKDVSDAHQGSSKVSPDGPAGGGEIASDHGSTYVSHDRDFTGHLYVSPETADHGSFLSDPPPPSKDLPPIKRSTSQPDDEEVRTELALSARPKDPEGPSVVVEIRPGASQEAPYLPSPKRVSFAQQNLAAATARRAKARAAHQAQEAQ